MNRERVGALATATDAGVLRARAECLHVSGASPTLHNSYHPEVSEVCNALPCGMMQCEASYTVCEAQR